MRKDGKFQCPLCNTWAQMPDMSEAGCLVCMACGIEGAFDEEKSRAFHKKYPDKKEKFEHIPNDGVQEAII